VLGFKFQQLNEKLQASIQAAIPKPVGKEASLGIAGAPKETIENLEEKIPKKLLLLTAILISNGIMSLEDIWPHLGKQAEEFKEDNDHQGATELDEVENLINRQLKFAQ
jgi:hypothetical protein